MKFKFGIIRYFHSLYLKIQNFKYGTSKNIKSSLLKDVNYANLQL